VSEENTLIGRNLYGAGDAETKAWFEKQWKIWPRRADPKLTTNISLHYGGVCQFRIEHGRDPEMSRDFLGCVKQLDKYATLSTHQEQSNA